MKPTHHTNLAEAKQSALDMAKETQEPIFVTEAVSQGYTPLYVAGINQKMLGCGHELLHVVHPSGYIEG